MQMTTPITATAAATEPTPIPILVAVERLPSGWSATGGAEVVAAGAAAAVVEEWLVVAALVAEEVPVDEGAAEDDVSFAADSVGVAELLTLELRLELVLDEVAAGGGAEVVVGAGAGVDGAGAADVVDGAAGAAGAAVAHTPLTAATRIPK